MQSNSQLAHCNNVDTDAHSARSMQELEPSPVGDSALDLEACENVPKLQSSEQVPRRALNSESFSSRLGFRSHRWVPWLATVQKYSTYPPIFFVTLHFFNTSLVPLVTRSLPSSERYLLLTRPIYQSGLEHGILTVPILAHAVSGIVLRNIRASRHMRLYGTDSEVRRTLLQRWHGISLQARLGYAFIPLIGTHVLANRVAPRLISGSSSSIGFGYVAYGLSRHPIIGGIYYAALVAIGVWHIVGGLATWLGWGVSPAHTDWWNRGTLTGYLGSSQSVQHLKRRRKAWWIINSIAAISTSVWLVGALGVIGRSKDGSPEEMKRWSKIYSEIPIIGKWL